jgi:hypothetical protein
MSTFTCRSTFLYGPCLAGAIDVNVLAATGVLMLPLHFPGVPAVACVPATGLPAVAGTLLLL